MLQYNKMPTRSNLTEAKLLEKIVKYFFGIIACFGLPTFVVPLQAQNSAEFSLSAVNFSYADLADLATEAPMVVDLRIRKIRKLPETQTVGVPENLQRVLAEADVISLLRGKGGIAERQRFLIDLPRDERGKIPKVKKRRYFAFAKAVPGRTDFLQLTRPDALAEYGEASNNMLRNILREAVRIDAPQKITGISSAFHSPGTIIGEGETQIFLTTETGQPFGISVTSQSGGARNWTVSTSEVISDALPAPKRETLLWYRLACGLPPALSPQLVGSQDSSNVRKAVSDYQYVQERLGPCQRTRKAPLRS